MAASYKGGSKSSAAAAAAAAAAAGTSEKDRWIHRDKLTQIEIQEYRDLGLEPPADLLRRAAESRAQAASREQAEALRTIRSPSPYRYDENEEYHLEEDADDQYYERNGENGELDEDDNDGEFIPVDPRSPEEIAADPYEEGRLTPSLRKSNSKIPLAPYSLVPVPQEHLDRGQPLPRKRGASAGFDDRASPGLAYPRTRARKDSASSAIADDQPIASSPISGPLTPASPNKQRTPQQRSASSKTTSSKTKTGSQRNVSSPRARDRSSTPSRPGTASGERPRTANRPEGDPPWLATMWKPDPRLPPDQQMLPTHAKRMMQEQMEREGKAGQTYDKDLNAVQGFSNEDEMLEAENRRLRQSEAEEIDRVASPTTGDRSAGWPLSADMSLGGGDFGNLTPSPTKSNADRSPGKKSGYSTVPRVTDSPKPQIGLFPSPSIGGAPEPVDPARNTSPRPPQPQPKKSALKQPGPREEMGLQTRVTGGLEDEQEKENKKKGGCGCCVVM